MQCKTKSLIHKQQIDNAQKSSNFDLKDELFIFFVFFSYFLM